MDGTIAYFANVMGRAEDGDAYRAWFRDGPSAALASLPGLVAYDLYEPEVSHDPYLNDGPGPLVMAQLYFPDIGTLENALDDPAFPTAALKGDGAPAIGLEVTHEAMRTQYFPVAGQDEPAPLTATLSYVVRYHRPAEDEAAFIDFYVKHHPPLLGEFPNIRNVMCYLPITWRDPTGIARSDYMLGNEVVFDSIDDLNAALKSDVRHRLRDDYKTFPPFTGANTHYAMTRTRIVPG